MELSSSQLPIIDFTEDSMKPGTKTWDLTCKHVRMALEGYGCFEATFCEINHELYTDLFSSLEKLFDLPKETKLRLASDVPFRGYASDSPLSPLLESIGITDPVNLHSFQSLANSMWPQGDSPFCETLNTYATRVLGLEKAVREAIYQSYGLERHFEKESESMKWTLRLMKYGAPMTDEVTRGVGMHYDKNFITILHADGVGLQVQNKHGEWISPTPSASSLIVMMGELFFGWSNGRLRCPMHRVMLSGFKSRYSIGLFSSKIDTIEIHSEMVDKQHPLLFKPFNQAGILKAFMQQVKDKAVTGNDHNIVPTVSTLYAI